MSYNIKATIRTGYDGSGVLWNYMKDCGEFRHTIDFNITGPDPKKGVIVQKIEKKTTAVVYSEDGEAIVLPGDSTIIDYTDGNVKFMNESYLELFWVGENGSLGYGDQFGNGAIAKYTENPSNDNQIEPEIDDKKDVCTGKIKQTGELVFILYSA